MLYLQFWCVFLNIHSPLCNAKQKKPPHGLAYIQQEQSGKAHTVLLDSWVFWLFGVDFVVGSCLLQLIEEST